ncbi:MAG: hypothetical protein Q9163_004265 [Psora crenata]
MASTNAVPGPFSVRLVVSYVIDWIVIVRTWLTYDPRAIAAVGAGFSQITPNRRPFDLTDPEISFPFQGETISTVTLFIVSLVAPAVLIFIISLFIGLGPTSEHPSRTAALKRKLWEWNAGWMGLTLAIAVSFLISNGTKQVVGKPRPDLLARCNPDLSRRLNSAVGGIGDQTEEGINLVSWTICRQTDMSVLDEGFRAFPSGHSTMSFAGLTYLALFICAKFAITIPFLNYQNLTHSTEPAGLHTPIRSRAAAPPTYLLIFPLIPIGVAIYISSTRYSDFWHHGFDVIAGAILGIASAWLGFRWYHLPIQEGGGWAWAPRSPNRAFARGIGVLTYVDDKVQDSKAKDIESGRSQYGAQGAGLVSRGLKTGETDEGVEMGATGYGRGRGHNMASDSSQRPLR